MLFHAPNPTDRLATVMHAHVALLPVPSPHDRTTVISPLRIESLAASASRQQKTG
jgi:hypothetical protein